MELGLRNTWSLRDPSHCTKIKLAKYRQLHSTARWGTHVLCGPLEKNQGINFPTSKAGTGTKSDISALKGDEKQVPTLLPNRGQWNKSQESQVYLKLNWAQSPMWHSSEPTAINSPSPLAALTFSGLLTTKGWKRFLRTESASGPAEPLCAQSHVLQHRGPLRTEARGASSWAGSATPGPWRHLAALRRPALPAAFPTGRLTYPGGLLLCRLSWHSLCLPGWSEPLQRRKWVQWLKSPAEKTLAMFQDGSSFSRQT